MPADGARHRGVRLAVADEYQPNTRPGRSRQCHPVMMPQPASGRYRGGEQATHTAVDLLATLDMAARMIASWSGHALVLDQGRYHSRFARTNLALERFRGYGGHTAS
jgi:hypothetical protein